ncbi:MAG: DUF1501 domain-containing protein [Pirellulaceae bacterium]|nr:DUF1501 domain-containing protein [Pirellulaceae bacterium]
MLPVFARHGRLNRRQLLTLGTLGLGGLTLPSLLAARAAAGSSESPLTGKSVIFLFQQGGPSQLETFDPKPDAPSGVRTVTGTVQTTLPGVWFGDSMAQLSQLAHKLTIVRSFQTNNGGHNIQPLVGPDSLEANIGVHFARVAGATRPDTGMPTNAVVYPSAVSTDVPGPQARGNLRATGPYAAGYAPFVPGAGGNLQDDMQLHLSPERFVDDRLSVLRQLDRLNRHVDASGQLEAMDQLQAQAYRLLLGGGVGQALDLSLEDPRTVARYDTSRYVRKSAWDKVARGRSGYYSGQARTIGKLLLLARRLCEAGCGFVTIHAGYAGVWDMHADGNNLNMVDGMEAVGRSFDHAVAAFVEDLEQRGLRDKILLVATGEMGRTPRLNQRGGRDHWGKLAPLLLYGGGLAGGQVIGQSTRDGGEPVTDNHTPPHLIATILQTLLDVGQLRLASGVPPQVLQLAQHAPIAGLV